MERRIISPRPGLHAMRRDAAAIREQLNKVDRILSVVDDGDALAFADLADLSTESYKLYQDADDLNRYAQMLASAYALGTLEPLGGVR